MLHYFSHLYLTTFLLSSIEENTEKTAKKKKDY